VEGRAPKERGEALIFFISKCCILVHFSYTNSKVLFAIKCRERYVIVVVRELGILYSSRGLWRELRPIKEFDLINPIIMRGDP